MKNLGGHSFFRGIVYIFYGLWGVFFFASALGIGFLLALLLTSGLPFLLPAFSNMGISAFQEPLLFICLVLFKCILAILYLNKETLRILIALGEILLSIPFFYLLQAYAFAEQLHFASVATSMMNLKLLLTIEIIILVTAFVSHPYINPQAQTLGSKLWTIFTIYIPGLYVLLYKQAGWKRLIGVVQFLLFLFILPGLTIDISLVWLPVSILLLLMWWSRRMQKNISRLATKSSRT